ncbi:MAG: cbb3-type cytochrome oxidase assembly protein CcoS [Desulfuromonadales bacterium]|nr:cbb3-type cytochrome oxidase assembly protein CcoS [Desulfuromonadales bacterium]
MLQSTIILIILSLCVGLGVWLVFLWAVRRGEFDDLEGPKYRMLDDDDDEPEPTVRRQGADHDTSSPPPPPRPADHRPAAGRAEPGRRDPL